MKCADLDDEVLPYESVDKHVSGDSVAHSVSLSALSSQQVFFGRDVGKINSQARGARLMGSDAAFASRTRGTCKRTSPRAVRRGFLQNYISSSDRRKLVSVQSHCWAAGWGTTIGGSGYILASLRCERCCCCRLHGFQRHQPYVTRKQMGPLVLEPHTKYCTALSC